jgi:hypothetical protein
MQTRTLAAVLDALEADLADLRAILAPFAGLSVQRSAPASRVSPAKRAVYVANGRYVAAMRWLSEADRARVVAVRKSKGVPAAVALARKLRKVGPKTR